MSRSSIKNCFRSKQKKKTRQETQELEQNLGSHINNKQSRHDDLHSTSHLPPLHANDMITYKMNMPESRDVAVILTLCEYGDYLCADLQTDREAQSSDDEAITKMLGSVGPWADALDIYMAECKKVVEWSIERHEHGPRPATPIYKFLKQEAERHGMSITELDDRISGFVERKNRCCDNSVQNLISAKDWRALANMLYTDMGRTWQDKSLEGASVRVVYSAMHRVKDQWFEYIRSVPVHSESDLGTGAPDLKTPDVEFKVRKGADQEVERRKEEVEGTLALDSPGFMEGEAVYLDRVAQERCSCEIRAEGAEQELALKAVRC